MGLEMVCLILQFVVFILMASVTAIRSLLFDVVWSARWSCTSSSFLVCSFRGRCILICTSTRRAIPKHCRSTIDICIVPEEFILIDMSSMLKLFNLAFLMSFNQNHLSSMPLTDLGFQTLGHKRMLVHNINPSTLPDKEAVTQRSTSVDEPRCLIHCASKVANDFTSIAFSLQLLVFVDAC